MAATILQWNARGLRGNRRNFDVIGEHQPDVICLQETKLEHSPPLSHYRCDNYDGYCKSLRRNPDQFPCGRVLVYIKKGLYHSVVRIHSHLQAIAVRVTLGGTPITILSVNYPGNNHLTTRDLSNLIRNIRGQIPIMGDFNGHNCLWGSHEVDTRGEVIERFTDKHNLCVFNDGTHTYLKPQAQHVNKPMSAIDTQPSCDPSHWVFSRADWEQFHDLCLEGVTEDMLEEVVPLHSFVKHITKAANNSIPRATTIPKKSNPWFDEECQEALRQEGQIKSRIQRGNSIRFQKVTGASSSTLQPEET